MDRKKSILLRFLLIIGLLIFFYPNISDYINSFSQTTGIVTYNEALSEFDTVEIEKIRAAAITYNQKIFEEKDSLYNPALIPDYEKMLNPFNDGMMGSLVIDKIGLNLPIYHGVNEGVIQKGIGHIPGTSLPIGGASTHAILSTHSGLPQARLFTDLHKLVEGDEFLLSILGKTIAYEVDQITTVLPKEVETLKVYEGGDYITLCTCTPYGINTHRLLVRGKRIDKTDLIGVEQIEEKAKYSSLLSIGKLALIFGLVLFVFVTILKDFYYFRKEKATTNFDEGILENGGSDEKSI